ncbi:MAG: response regulator [Dehalococcoidia bacterium]
MSIRILVVDDQPLVRAGFRLILGSEPAFEVVGESEDGRAAIEMAQSLSPDVVLMDVRMPVMDGLAAARAILGRPGAARVVMLTTFDLDEYVHEALSIGASGFLLKDVTPERLIAAIHDVARGEMLVAPQVLRRLASTFVRHPPAQPLNLRDPLTNRELEVLAHVARGQSNAEIAGELVLSEATVKTHVVRIFSKLEVRDRVQAVIWAHRHGIGYD